MPTKKRPAKESLITLYTRGMSDGEIAQALKVNKSTVYRWKRHYGLKVKYGVKPQEVQGV
jgi:transposase